MDSKLNSKAIWPQSLVREYSKDHHYYKDDYILKKEAISTAKVPLIPSETNPTNPFLNSRFKLL